MIRRTGSTIVKPLWGEREKMGGAMLNKKKKIEKTLNV